MSFLVPRNDSVNNENFFGSFIPLSVGNRWSNEISISCRFHRVDFTPPVPQTKIPFFLMMCSLHLWMRHCMLCMCVCVCMSLPQSHFVVLLQVCTSRVLLSAGISSIRSQTRLRSAPSLFNPTTFTQKKHSYFLTICPSQWNEDWFFCYVCRDGSSGLRKWSHF